MLRPRGAPAWRTEPADPNAGLFGEAAVALARDNLAAAVEVARRIGGLCREVLSDRVEDAEARVALDDLARRINDVVVRGPGTAPRGGQKVN